MENRRYQYVKKAGLSCNLRHEGKKYKRKKAAEAGVFLHPESNRHFGATEDS